MPDIEKRIFSFNRDGKVSASGTDMPELSHFCVWKQAGKAGLNSAWSEAGLQQEPGACRYPPGCAEQQRWLGLEAALREKALHPARSSQAPSPKKQQAPASWGRADHGTTSHLRWQEGHRGRAVPSAGDTTLWAAPTPPQNTSTATSDPH